MTAIPSTFRPSLKLCVAYYTIMWMRNILCSKHWWKVWRIIIYFSLHLGLKDPPYLPIEHPISLQLFQRVVSFHWKLLWPFCIAVPSYRSKKTCRSGVYWPSIQISYLLKFRTTLANLYHAHCMDIQHTEFFEKKNKVKAVKCTTYTLFDTYTKLPDSI